MNLAPAPPVLLLLRLLQRRGAERPIRQARQRGVLVVPNRSFDGRSGRKLIKLRTSPHYDRSGHEMPTAHHNSLHTENIAPISCPVRSNVTKAVHSDAQICLQRTAVTDTNRPQTVRDT